MVCKTPESNMSLPRNKNAALPVKAQRNLLTISGLKKMGPRWRLQPRAFAPQASVMASGVRDDVSHNYTCFMRRGEDARLHERFYPQGAGTRPHNTLSSIPCGGVRLGDAGICVTGWLICSTFPVVAHHNF